MKAAANRVLSLAALGLALGISGAALATSVETRHSALDLAREAGTVSAAGQAGRAGPESVPGMARATGAGTLETEYSAVWLARELAADTAPGQAGRPGPESLDRQDQQAVPFETQSSIIDLPR